MEEKIYQLMQTVNANPSDAYSRHFTPTLLPEYTIIGVSKDRDDEITRILLKAFKEAYCKTCKFNGNYHSEDYDIATCGDRCICDKKFDDDKYKI